MKITAAKLGHKAAKVRYVFRNKQPDALIEASSKVWHRLHVDVFFKGYELVEVRSPDDKFDPGPRRDRK